MKLVSKPQFVPETPTAPRAPRPRKPRVKLRLPLWAHQMSLPLAFAGALLLRVNRQIAGAGREPGQPVCTVTMLEEGVRTVNEGQEEAQEADWQSIKRAYRRKGCVYLYVTEQKAFLLPSRQADAPDAEVWDFICEHLGREKCRG